MKIEMKLKVKAIMSSLVPHLFRVYEDKSLSKSFFSTEPCCNKLSAKNIHLESIPISTPITEGNTETQKVKIEKIIQLNYSCKDYICMLVCV